MQKTLYFPEIDGLRAFAILLVLLYHVGFAWLPGGYVGVDIFFVISGLLITRQIIQELQATGAFSFGRFYVRRARRLLPALFVTILFSVVVSFAMLSSADLAGLGRAAVAAALSVSNILFWMESGYFDVAAEFKPLLHTWSLSVEEQYYLFWPLLVVMCARRVTTLVLMMAVVIAISFALNAALFNGWIPGFSEAASAAFYLLPTRAFQFASGAVLVPLLMRWRRPWLIGEAMILAGLVLVIGSACFYDGTTRFPYLAALPPTIGAMLLILGSVSARFGNHLFSNMASTGLGKISYSIYLVHWPIVVFLRYPTLSPLDGLGMALALLMTVLCGTVLYFCVERPLRIKVDKPASVFAGVVLPLSSAAMLLVLLGGLLQVHNGLNWRIPEAQRGLNNEQLRLAEWGKYCQSFNPALPQDLVTCQFDRGKERDIFIWGDSHALHLVAGFAENYPDHNIYVLFMVGCVPQSGFADFKREYDTAEKTYACVARNEWALSFFASYRPSTVIVTSAKRSSPQIIAPISAEIMRRLRASGQHAILLGDFIRPGKPLLNCRAVPRWLLTEAQLLQRCQADAKMVKRELAYNAAIKSQTADFIDVATAQCPNGVCQFVEGEAILFRDDHHLSMTGSVYFLKQLKPQLTVPD